MKKSLAGLLLLMFVATGSLTQSAPTKQQPPAAQAVAADFPEINSYHPREAFPRRRLALARKIGDATAIILAAKEPAAYVPFRQNNTFFYFTGLDTPRAVLMVRGGENPRSVLFLPEVSERQIRSEGPRLTTRLGNVKELTGMDEVRPLEQLYAMFLPGRESIVTERTVFTMFAPEELGAASRDRLVEAQSEQFADPWDGRASREQQFVSKLRTQFPAVTVRDLTPIVDEMRWVKDDAEIRAIRDNGRIAAEGIAEAIRATRPGLCEQELADVARYVWARRGAQADAYFPIVASAQNSLVWHYHSNKRRIQPNDLVLIDYAPDFEYIDTDITRVWPASGRFSDEQTRYYNVVLEAHRAMIDAMKPGVTIKQIGDIGKAAYAKHGLEKAWKGPGHFVGMSTHDPGPYERPLVPGVVFNVEPLLDLPDKGYHLRLEDTVLVTANGYEILTMTGLPWDLESIYKMRDAGSKLNLPPLSNGATRVNCK